MLIHEGDEVWCECGQWHRAFRNTPNVSTADKDFLYIRCRGGLYFVGTDGTECRHEMRPATDTPSNQG